MASRWPGKHLGRRDLAELAQNPRGWAAYGHPEWGAFRLGKANPNHATSGLLSTIAVSRLGDARIASALESSVQRSDSCSRAIRSARRSTFRLRIIPRRTRKLLSIVMIVNLFVGKGFHRLAS